MTTGPKRQTPNKLIKTVHRNSQEIIIEKNKGQRLKQRKKEEKKTKENPAQKNKIE